MSFFFPLIHFLQPSILWPDLKDFRPAAIMAGLALIAGYRRPPSYSRSAAFKHPLFKYLVWFLLAQVASVYYGGFGAMLDEASFWSAYLVFSVVSIILLSDVKQVRRYVWGMILGGMWVVAYGIYALIYKIGFAAVGRAGAYGMYDNHNDYTFIILQILPFIYAFRRIERGFFKRTFLLLSLVTCVVGVLLSLSRGGILALLLECLLIIVLVMTGRSRWLLIPVLAVVGAGAVGYQWAKRAENSTTYTAEDAESSRYELWRAARKMIIARPILGVGSRRFGEHSQEYEDLSHDQRGKNSHNTFLEILATTGLAGFIPFLLMCRALVREMRSRVTPPPPEIIEMTSKATAVAFYTILFRAMFDAKTYDWSFYTLAVLALACVMLREADPDVTAEERPWFGNVRPKPARA